MNARIKTPTVDLPPHDLELEENAIGIALLGYPWPDWLEAEDFWAGPHQRIYWAVKALGATANLPTVNAYLRDVDTDAYHPAVVSSAELFRMMQEASHAMDMGWSVDFDRLRELANQRRLVERMQRLLVKFRHGAVDFDDACGELLEVF